MSPLQESYSKVLIKHKVFPSYSLQHLNISLEASSPASFKLPKEYKDVNLKSSEDCSMFPFCFATALPGFYKNQLSRLRRSRSSHLYCPRSLQPLRPQPIKRGFPSLQVGKYGRSREIKSFSPLPVTGLRIPFILQIPTSKWPGEWPRKITYQIRRLIPGLLPFSWERLLPWLLTPGLFDTV